MEIIPQLEKVNPQNIMEIRNTTIAIYDVLSIHNAELLLKVRKADWPANEVVCLAAAKSPDRSMYLTA